VARLVDETFVPVRVHVKQQTEEYQRLSERFGAQWTPTVLVVDRTGRERHRIEGFLPVDDFVSQLAMGAAHAAFAAGDYASAARRFDEIVEAHASTEAAPEALYWAGVSRYKASGNPAALKETARRFSERFQDTSWAKKASVWR
jgi:hypothetical protein